MPSNFGTSSFIFGGLWVVFGAGLGEEEDGEAEGLDACSRLATCRRSSSILSATFSWLEASFAMASSRRSKVDLERESSIREEE